MSSTGFRGRVWGDGPRRALLLHGSASSSATWWRVGPDLAARGWSVTAPDLPGHGANPPADAPVLPATSAAAVARTCAGEPFDLLVGHSFGATVAVELLARWPEVARRMVLEELPGAGSVDWAAEGDAVVAAATAATERRADEVAATQADHPRWADEDCRHAVDDLARCSAQAVAAALRRGQDWATPDSRTAPPVPVMLLLAPDASGLNRLEDATALRGAERERTVRALGADVRVLPTGHCVHRDDPGGWLSAVLEFGEGVGTPSICPSQRR